MISTDDYCRRVPEVLRVELVEDTPEPVIDHRQLRAVVGSDLARLCFAQSARGLTSDDVRRPDEAIGERAVLIDPRFVVVHRRPWLGRVEWFMRVELVDEQHPPAIVLWHIVQPGCGRTHGARTREVFFGPKPGATVVVVSTSELRVVDVEPLACEPAAVGSRRDDGWRTERRRIWIGPPRVTFVSSQIVPRAEVGVVVLAAGLEEVRVV